MVIFSSDTAEGERIAWCLDLDRGRELLLPFVRDLTPSYFGQYEWGTHGTFAGRIMLAASLFRAVFGKLPSTTEATKILSHVRQFRETGWSVFDWEIRSWIYQTAKGK